MRALREYGFPVLGKELVEQSERKRTYLTRVVFVLFLSIAFLVSYGAIRSSGSRPQDLLGSGRQIFSSLIRLQLAAIFLYVPILMSGAIAREKERNSLALLLLTRLRPGEIILEKLLAKLTPVFTLQCVSLPLLAIAYSLGGVSTTYFWCSVYVVFLTCLQVGSLTLMLSCYYRTTVAAFALSYLLVPVIGLASLLLDLYNPGLALGRVAFVLWTPSLIAQAEGQTFAECALSSAPALLSIGVLLLLARSYLFLRVDTPARNYGVRLFRRIDRLMHAANRHFGDVVLIPDRSSLPGDEPVAWREVDKKALGKPRYVVRVLLVLQIPSVAVALAASGGLFRRSAFRANLEYVSTAVLVLWVIVVLVLGVLGTSLIVSERTQQTLDVLLTTPLPRSEIIRQKTRGLARLIKVLWVPFLTLFLFGAAVRSSGSGEGIVVLYLLTSCLTVAIYLPLLGWLATFLGLRLRSRLAAFVLFLVCVIVWSSPPLLILPGGPLGGYLEPSLLLLLSPLTAVLVAELHRNSPSLYELFTVWAVLLNGGIYGYVFYRLRRACLRRAERYLHAA